MLTRIKESYFLEDVDNSGASELPSDAKLVGGTIFYIDDEAGGEYQFFDAEGNVIENAGVGDRPYAYRVIRKGSKDKYYVYHDKVYNNARWTYYKDKNYVYESLGASKDIGYGKTNTEKAMAEDSGAYITGDSNGLSTIWYQLQQARIAKVGGCDDWYIPALYEIEKLRKAIKSGSITGGAIAGSSYSDSVFANKWVWSSSESFSQGAFGWNYIIQAWDYCGKNYDLSVFFIRAF